MSKKNWGMLAALIATLLAAYFSPPTDNEVQPTIETDNHVEKLAKDSLSEQVSSSDTKLHSALGFSLKPKARKPLDQLPKDLFHKEPSKAEQAAIRMSKNAINIAKPTAPPLPFIYMGKLVDKSNTSIFLTRDDKPYVVNIGDIVDGAYRIDAINPSTLEFTYLPLLQKQKLNMTTTNSATYIHTATSEGQTSPQNVVLDDTETQRIKDALKKLMGQAK